jgi:hypothetical protein
LPPTLARASGLAKNSFATDFHGLKKGDNTDTACGNCERIRQLITRGLDGPLEKSV